MLMREKRRNKRKNVSHRHRERKKEKVSGLNQTVENLYYFLRFQRGLTKKEEILIATRCYG